MPLFFFFFNDTATTEIYTLSLHDALPIYSRHLAPKASALPGCATPRGCRILRLRPWHGQRRRTGKFPVKSDLPALLISGIKLPSFHCFTRRLRFGAAPQILPSLPAEQG